MQGSGSKLAVSLASALAILRPLTTYAGDTGPPSNICSLNSILDSTDGPGEESRHDRWAMMLLVVGAAELVEDYCSTNI